MNRPPSRQPSTPQNKPRNAGNAPKPVQEIRIGSIKASIWANATSSGTMHNVKLSRIYKSGDEWKRTESFGRDDLLTLAKIADLAHTWIVEHHGSPGSQEEQGHVQGQGQEPEHGSFDN